MSTKLDRSKPYGAIHGEAQGRRYEQDGRYFCADGSQWRDPSAKESAAERAAREKAEAEAELAAKAKAAEEGEDDQLSKQLGA